MKTEEQLFIENRLNHIYSKFSEIKIRYEFDSKMKLHIIEILPQNLFEENAEYIYEEIKLEEDFEERFSGKEEILFVSEDSLNKINKPTFQLGYKSLTYTKIEIEEIIDNNISFKIESYGSICVDGNDVKISSQTKIESESFALAA